MFSWISSQEERPRVTDDDPECPGLEQEGQRKTEAETECLAQPREDRQNCPEGKPTMMTSSELGRGMEGTLKEPHNKSWEMVCCKVRLTCWKQEKENSRETE